MTNANRSRSKKPKPQGGRREKGIPLGVPLLGLLQRASSLDGLTIDQLKEWMRKGHIQGRYIRETRAWLRRFVAHGWVDELPDGHYRISAAGRKVQDIFRITSPPPSTNERSTTT